LTPSVAAAAWQDAARAVSVSVPNFCLKMEIYWCVIGVSISKDRRKQMKYTAICIIVIGVALMSLPLNAIWA
jgi:hypothetical protein